MATTVGSGKNGRMAEMNVTPLIDVLLVLLIIFMVITPLTPSGLDAVVPQGSTQPRVPEGPTPSAIVVTINAEHQIRINQESISLDALGGRLTDIFKVRNERVLFVQGAPSLPFAEVAAVVDIARGAGVESIGLLTKPLQ